MGKFSYYRIRLKKICIIPLPEWSIIQVVRFTLKDR